MPGNYTDQATYNQAAPWHLYIATTFDAGLNWTTIDATPTDPVQRGSICNLGTTSCMRTPNDRNLLDFMDATVDAKGRIVVGYPDGCVKEYSAPAVIAVEPGHDGWVVGDEPAIVIEFDFENETPQRLGLGGGHRHD